VFDYPLTDNLNKAIEYQSRPKSDVVRLLKFGGWLESITWNVMGEPPPFQDQIPFPLQEHSYEESLVRRVNQNGGVSTPRGALAALKVLNRALFESEEENAVLGDGFSGLQLTGNTEEYYVPENSFLNKVLETRKGIPIT
jgi:hypothetical protein